MKATLRHFAVLAFCLLGAALHAAGSLKVTLAPTAAVTAGARWRVDGGAWQSSGATVKGLFAGTHNVEFKPISGWIAPSLTAANIANGATTTLAATYVQTSSLAITLTPSSGQWRIDGGAWQPSGATVVNLTPGAHTVDYANVAGYLGLASETVTLASGQTTTLARAYTQLANLTITLSPTSGQWRVDGGAWQPSGATLGNLAPGSHTVDYTVLPGYSSLPSETITLSAGESRPLSRSYVELAQLSLTLSPSNGQWRIDGGAWQSSGATVANLAPGNHTIEYSTLSAGWGTPPTETIALSAGQTLSLQRNYSALNQVMIMLVPSSGKWRVNGGTWQDSGATVWVGSGTYTVDYSPLDLYDAPASESFSNGLIGTRYYTSQKPSLRVNLGPTTGQWRLDDGAWQPSGAELTELDAGIHTISYSDIGSPYATLPAETISLALRDHVTLTRTYSWLPASFTLHLTPSNATWRLIGPVMSASQPSGATLTGLPPGTYHIEFGNILDYTTPANETIVLSAGQPTTLFRSYTPLPGSLQVITIVSGSRWRVFPEGSTPVDAWHYSGDTVTGLAVGNYTVEYAPLAHYAAPPAESVTILRNQLTTLNRPYLATPAEVTVTLTPNEAQWRIYPSQEAPSGTWQESGATVGGLAPADYIIEFSDVAGYVNPGANIVSLTAGQSFSLSRTYAAETQLTVTLQPATAQWRIDGGPWLASGFTAVNVGVGTHIVEYQPCAGFATPSTEYVNLYRGVPVAFERHYAPLAQINVTLWPETAQWRVDNGEWQNSGATVGNLDAGHHTIEYRDLLHYTPPPAESVYLSTSEAKLLSRGYTRLGQLTVTLWPETAQWRVNGGEWQASGAMVDDLPSGFHSIEYRDLLHYTAPPPETVYLFTSEAKLVSRGYTRLGQLTVTLWPETAQWRVNGGEWQASGAMVDDLPSGFHSIEYRDLLHYTAPPPESVYLFTSEAKLISRGYTRLGQLTVTLWPETAQWRVSGGEWQASGATVDDLPSGYHVIDYRDLPGYITPDSESIYLFTSQALNVSRSYAPVPAQRLRFFIHTDLAGSLPITEVQNRIAQYASHVTQILTRETRRTFVFSADQDVLLCSSDPFSGTYAGTLPEHGYDVWIYARLTDDAATGTYGGALGVDSGFAGGIRDMKWDQIHNPSALADNTPALAQYWRQLHLIVRGLERMYGAGAYESFGGLKDVSGVAPILPDVAAPDSITADPFWDARTDYWTDPLTANAHANPRVGSPTSLSTLLNLTSFAPVTEAVINRGLRNPSRFSASLPNMFAVTVTVVDAETHAPIPAATVRIWNRQHPSAPASTYEETVTSAGNPGVFTFSWTGADTAALSENDTAKIVKAYAPGYTAAAKWVTLYDAQTVKLVEYKDVFEITLPLTRE